MKVAAISDTHGREGWGVPHCDVLVNASDMTGAGTCRETPSASRSGYRRFVVTEAGVMRRCFVRRER